MIFATCALTYVKVSERVEAALQNLAAGLILAAVACELFPIMRDDQGGEYGGISTSDIGISIGFAIGLLTIYGMEYLTHVMEEMSTGSNKKGDEYQLLAETDDSPVTDSALTTSLIPSEFQDVFYDDPDNPHTPELVQDLANVQFEESHVEIASNAIMSSPQHKDHIREHLMELLESIKFMEERSFALTNHSLPIREVESIAESIDERIHSLQYKLDHCRRYVYDSCCSTHDLVQFLLFFIHFQTCPRIRN